MEATAVRARTARARPPARERPQVARVASATVDAVQAPSPSFTQEQTDANSLRRTLLIWALALALMALSACGGDPVSPYAYPTYRLEVSGESFTIQVADPSRVADFEARLASGEQGVVLGSIVEGDGGFNDPWSWHMTPESVAVADLAIEVCDGRPSMVEADLDYWLNTLAQFCPWGATVVERLD